MKRSIDHGRAQAEPHLIWNAFVDLLAMEDYETLSALQRTAHLAFWYESEVENGGHGQYLENRGVDRLRETIQALEALGLPCHARLVSQIRQALPQNGEAVEWEEALSEDFLADLDERFADCAPTITEGLQRHLEAHRAEYIEWS